MTGGHPGSTFRARWSRDRAWTIQIGLDHLVDDLSWLRAAPASPPAPSIVPLESGCPGFDEVCGGLRRGQLTLVEADHAAQATAVAHTVARRCPHPTLLDSASVTEAVTWILSGTAGVPAALIATGDLSSAAWRAIADAVGRLDDRALHLSETRGATDLAEVTRRVHPEVLVLVDLERFGTIRSSISFLAELATESDAAVLATCRPIPDWVVPDHVATTRVSVVASDLGGRATLIGSDDYDPLAVYQAHIEPLLALVR